MEAGNFNAFVNIEQEILGLTDEEKRQLELVMQKAREFEEEEENKIRRPLEGQLYKYTNVVKGWQYRWFVLTPETGMLEYYMMDEIKKHRPRGALHLAGAVITPSDEDSLSFTVNAVCGEVYKLKAADAKERHFWITRLRAAAEYHTKSSPDKATVIYRELRSSSNPLQDQPLAATNSKFYPSSVKSIPVSETQNTSLTDSLSAIKISVDQAFSCHKLLAKMIEDLPLEGSQVKCSDTNLLLLKAISQAAVQSLEQCYTILRQKQFAMMHPSGLPAGATVQWVDKKPLTLSPSIKSVPKLS